MRIVSLSPSATETLIFIGGTSLLVGRCHNCDSPPEIRDLPIIKPGDAPGLLALEPDLVLAQDRHSAAFPALNHLHSETLRLVSSAPNPPAILSLNTETVEGIVDACLTVGAAAGLHESAQNAAIALRGQLFRACECVNPYEDGPAVAVITALDPLTVAGNWISQLVERAGGRHILNPTTAHPEAGMAVGPQQAQRDAPPPRVITSADLLAANLDFIILAVPNLPAKDAKSALQAESGGSPAAKAHPSKNDAPRLIWVDASSQLNLPSPRIAADLWFLAALLNNRPKLAPPDYPSVIL